MRNEDLEVLKRKFIRAFGSVPLKLRHEFIAIIDNAPVSWTAAYVEIENNTSSGKKILEQLKALGILKDDDE